jgi:hypothetical protein
MNLKEEMEKVKFISNGVEFDKGLELISKSKAIEIAEKYANFKMKLILGHFQRKCDNIEQSLNTFDKNEQLATELKDENL